MREESSSDIESFLIWADLVISQYGPNSPQAADLVREAQREYKRSQARADILRDGTGS
jgi:hypothetical protein